MKRTNWITSANLGIRGATLIGKFLLVYFLADQLTVEQNGVWGIFTTSIALSLYVVGLDFYTYSSRRILDFKEEDRSPMLRDQLVFYFISYLVLFPILGLLFVFNVIDIKFAIFFYAILIFEHLAQEAYRTFVVFSKPIIANIILFLRTGSWAYLILILWTAGVDELKSLRWLYLFWMCGGIAALAVSLYFLAKFKFKSVKHIPIDWKWIKQGIKVSLLFFIGTVGYKIIEFADRYFIDYYHTKEEVGVYTFYANMCNIVETFVHTAVIIIFSPRLIETFHKSNYDYRKTLAQFAKQVVIYTIIIGVALAILIIPLLKSLENDEYIRDYNAFVVLVLSKMVLNFSLIFHYILYVRKNDFPIIKATIIACVINILLNFILIPSMSIMGAALATLTSFLIVMLMKMYYTRNLPEAKQIIYLRFLRQRRTKKVNNDN
ncbi:MAG: polysaccharide biosynthesis C-terminal domain-containing protein [Bacteroidetes bacterium]|nr:polysaccharide biosynthesis C-terminal domain-containing protein [Bacteroidota bacterium]MBK9556906.1 polysaccharide biosynthesis C-terminal domain-containing protein [Bacteroidota bacterium]MBP9880541.1 polysaccharide biosynthesis C-terminal domain-containing protein [Chitinophagales bacterium]